MIRVSSNILYRYKGVRVLIFFVFHFILLIDEKSPKRILYIETKKNEKEDVIMKRLARLTVLPTDTKQNNFVLALVDYLDKELRNHKLKSKRNNGYVKVCLSNKYQDKYDSVVIDCMDGKMYLRGSGVSDRYFGRLSKYNGTRASDAYHCVNYNATRIINRINKIEQSFKPKEIVAHVIDLREDKIAVIDLRKDVITCNIFDNRVEKKIVADLRTEVIECNYIDMRKDKKVIADLREEKKITLDLRTEKPITRLKDIMRKAGKVIKKYFDMRK